MRLRAFALCIGFIGSLAACHRGSVACKKDSDCDSDQVCFVDGCGDPTRDIRVEVTPSSSLGRFAQDLTIDEVTARQDLQVPGPAILEGSVNLDPPQPSQTDTARVTLRALGESELIPGVLRSFESTIRPDSPNRRYSLPASSGVYTFTANVLNQNPSSPPLTAQRSATVRSGTIARLDFLFAAAPIYPVSGQLLGGPTPPDLEVQALADPIHLRPLSQRVAVSPSREFTLLLSPSVFLGPRFVIQAGPKDPNALIPEKMFSIDRVDNPPRLNLDLGNYGSPVSARGRLVSARSGPISGATVYLMGAVEGGGTFRSQSVLTDDSGNFSLTTLQSAAAGTSTLWAIPSAASTAGILRTAVAARGVDPVALGSFICPEKVLVQGKLYRADGSSAPSVRVVAVPIEAVPDKPLPANGAQSTTGDDSSFSMRLDPATYRLDFIPGEQLPRVSRFVTVTADPSDSGPGFKPLQLSDFTLSKGRRVTGNVFAVADAGSQPSAAPYATLRFFRLISLSGRQSSVLLAETVSDGRGAYSVALPTR